MIDPRLYQIATLASLLVYGMGWLDFGVTPARVCVVLLTVVATQAVCDRWNGASVNVKSALISGLSLCLLLRTNRTELADPGGGDYHRRASSSSDFAASTSSIPPTAGWSRCCS